VVRTSGLAETCGLLIDNPRLSQRWRQPKVVLFIEAVELYLGQVDRQLTMLRKAGHLDGISGVAIGQFTRFKSSKGVTIPILGGLPLGHGPHPATVTLGAVATWTRPPTP